MSRPAPRSPRSRRLLRIALSAALLPCLAAAEEAKPAPYSQKSAAEGVSLGLQILPLEKQPGSGLMEGDLVRFELSLADAGTGTPLPRLFPAAWMDRKPSAETAQSETCGDKLKMLLGGNLFTRAELNLNVYYVLAMNEDATLNVVDPLFGYGGSKLLAQVKLRSPGQDWVMGPEPRRVFVSQPKADAVAVVEPGGWKVLTHVPTGPYPNRLALQPDGAYLWAGFDRAEPGQEASGVSVLDPTGLKERARVRTGRGHHEIAFSGDSRFAFVTNAEDGTVAVVDVRRLEVVKTIPTGKDPVSITWCET
ncbi:MAG TPA: cytochrome D1, partial [Thermoanaerobaculia bacterium]|nr:cytochrome D1 [Thermoanaerobaculia bacterium]